MKTKTCFDDLPEEVIVYIFRFLSTTDRYTCFFDLNDRFRLLVKQQTEFNQTTLDADIVRFSTLHNWCKHLSFKHGGSLFYIIPTRGQQPRYIFDPCVTDFNGLHWWFLYRGVERTIIDEQVRTIITRYPLRLNPFFYHRNKQSNHSHWYEGSELILQRDQSYFRLWLTENYPKFKNINADGSDTNLEKSCYDLVPLFEGEWLKAITAIRIAAVQIWNELKELKHINPLEIKFENYFCS